MIMSSYMTYHILILFMQITYSVSLYLEIWFQAGNSNIASQFNQDSNIFQTNLDGNQELIFVGITLFTLFDSY